MGKFEDRLLSELMREHGPALAVAERPAPRRRAVSRPVWIAGAALTATGATIMGIAVFGTPAYAVTKNADGTVTVSISDIRAVEPANAELERVGARVRAVPIKAGCTDTYDAVPVDSRPVLSSVNQDNVSITIDVSKIATGTTLLLGAGTSPDGKVNALAEIGPVRGATPSCVPWPKHPS